MPKSLLLQKLWKSLPLPSNGSSPLQSPSDNGLPRTKKKIALTETILRDAHQSRLATRMATEDMLPVAEELDNAGFHSLEVWGGATFDSALRYLNEDPWHRLQELKRRIKKTPLQMLLRGQNLLGYHHYPDDVVVEFIQKAAKNGITIFRIFDALNDIRNMETSIKAVRDIKAEAQATVCYTKSPVHTIDHYLKTARELEKLGAHSICIKDMAGLLAPYEAFDLITALKKELTIPLQLHSHCTSGLAPMTYIKAIEAGVDVVDTSLSTLALGPSLPATETFIAALKKTPYDLQLDLEEIARINQHFKGVKERLNSFSGGVELDPGVLIYQIPGGMLSNMTNQMKSSKMEHLLEETLREVPRVREDLGYPPLVTPMSQIVGTQAIFNVVTKERYQVKSKELKSYLKGLYGRPPKEVDPDFREKILGVDSEFYDCRPADLLTPLLSSAREEAKGYLKKEEDLLTYILFPKEALHFFKNRG